MDDGIGLCFVSFSVAMVTFPAAIIRLKSREFARASPRPACAACDAFRQLPAARATPAARAVRKRIFLESA
ncbi:hypothetical protein [Paraburkholderia sp.]|uniref:hypothetical protein n=1 Tax=Paraburkholderia sp. TaxID=1926495 RepID=UPI0039E29BA5